MGMFDTIDVVGLSRIRCAAGHPQLSLQTKDIGEPSMSQFALDGGHLFKRLSSGPVNWKTRGGVLIALTEAVYEPAREISGAVHAYTHCDGCQPVCFEQDRAGLNWDRIDERLPWVEYQLLFSKGELTDLNPVRLESRDDVRRSLALTGVAVLPDDDRVVRRHLESWKNREKARM